VSSPPSSPRGFEQHVKQRLWQAGLTPSRVTLPGGHRGLQVAEYPHWRLRCHQARRWHLWQLFDRWQRDHASAQGMFALITVERGGEQRAVATLAFEALEAWLEGRAPMIVPRRVVRAAFAHHRWLAFLPETTEGMPLLVSRQPQKPLLLSVPLSSLKTWMTAFPPPQSPEPTPGTQLPLSLWSWADT